ncbi:MAG: response regulator [Planctomycetes bacterium]|nr:response regulator [Planctomycetota bacterium]
MNPGDGDVPLRILVLEDDLDDYELLLRHLGREKIRVESLRVQEEPQFLEQLEKFAPDLVISDFAMPAFDGLSALQLHLVRRPAVPFIFVSGTIGEETAVEALRKGATDYLLKGHLARLGPAVRRAVAEARAREERKKLELELYHAQKMEAVGRLAGGVAHDFNNLLTAILGYADIVAGRLPAGDALLEGMDEIRKAGRRAADLTRQLLAFSRKQVFTLQVANLNEILKGTERLLRRLIGEDIRFETRFDPALGNVRVDAGQIEQVVMNLAVNSRDAMPGGGRLTVATRNVRPDDPGLQASGEARHAAHVVLEVSDTGCGMDEATRARIFEPFFTTKEPGKGTGLGLATVYGIVRQSGGYIDVESAPGQGATFRIYLPSVSEPTTRTPPRRPPPVSARGTETIMIVEDEEAVRKLSAQVLRTYGYTVFDVADGSAALKLASGAKSMHLVITDLVMPVMGGKELARKMKAVHPETRILYMSGYPADSDVNAAELGPGADFMHKPFLPSDLARTVRELLDRPATVP